MSKELFFNMRAEEVALMYDHSFTKKECVLTGKRMVDNMLEAGEVDPIKVCEELLEKKTECIKQ